jgi:Amidase
MLPPSFDLASLRDAWRRDLKPIDLLREVLARCRSHDDPAVWIHRVDAAGLEARAHELDRQGPRGKALYGVPFAIQDNIDVEGLPTTAACPAFAYEASATAPVVQRLLDAGAILIGKANLDQFATGLVGTRSPYGAPRNPFDPRYRGRLQLRLGRGGGLGSGELRARDRYGGVGPDPGRLLQSRQTQADAGLGQRAWRGAGLPQPRLRLNFCALLR